MSLAAQAKVLRALEDGVIARVGSQRTQPVDVRVIAATNKDLSFEISAGRFREDLLYRLNVVPIEIPPLRARRGDIPQLIEHFVQQLSRSSGLPPKTFAPDALRKLSAARWPGNVRELRNAVERLLILASEDQVTAEDVAGLGGRLAPGRDDDGDWDTDSRRVMRTKPLGDPMQAGTFEDFKDAAERAFFRAKLEANDWNITETAKILGMRRSNLYKKIERYQLAQGAP